MRSFSRHDLLIGSQSESSCGVKRRRESVARASRRGPLRERACETESDRGRGGEWFPEGRGESGDTCLERRSLRAARTSSSTSHAVSIARLSHDVYTTSNEMPGQVLVNVFFILAFVLAGWGAVYLARRESALRKAQPGRWADPLGDAIKAARAWCRERCGGGDADAAEKEPLVENRSASRDDDAEG